MPVRIRRFAAFVLVITAMPLAAQQTIYWKKDHVYNGPGGKEIAVVMPTPTDQTAPTAPTGLTIGTVTATSVQLSWSSSTDSGGSGLTGYKVYRQQGTGASLPVGTVGPGVLSFADQPLVPSTSFTYTVVAFDNAENHSTASSAASATTSASSGDTVAPSIPTSLTGMGMSTTTIQLNWNASTDTGGSGVAGYRVYRNGSLVNSPTTNSFLDSSLTANTSYSYTVAAADNVGNVSGSSGAVSVSTTRTLVWKDDFNRADGDTSLSGCRYTFGGTQVSCWGWAYGWTTSMYASTSARSGVWVNALGAYPVTTDFKATLQVTNNAGSAGIYFWDNYPYTANPTTAWYVAYVTGTTLRVSFFQYPSTETVVASTAVSGPTGTISVETTMSSRTIKVYYNGTLQITYTETDNTRPNQGRIGMAQYVSTGAASDVYIDNFKLEQ